MHGVDRNAARYIGAAAPVAERHQALAIVIEFSRRDFPDTDDYTLGVTTRGHADESAAREGRWRAPEDFVYNVTSLRANPSKGGDAKFPV